MAAIPMLRKNVKLEIPQPAICGALTRQLHIRNNFTFGHPKKAVGHEPQIGPCVATYLTEQQGPLVSFKEPIGAVVIVK